MALVLEPGDAFGVHFASVQDLEGSKGGALAGGAGDSSRLFY